MLFLPHPNVAISKYMVLCLVTDAQTLSKLMKNSSFKSKFKFHFINNHFSFVAIARPPLRYQRKSQIVAMTIKHSIYDLQFLLRIKTMIVEHRSCPVLLLKTLWWAKLALSKWNCNFLQTKSGRKVDNSFWLHRDWLRSFLSSIDQ